MRSILKQIERHGPYVEFGTVTSLRPGKQGKISSNPGCEKRYSLPQSLHPNIRGPPNITCSGYYKSFTQGYSYQIVKLTSHLHLAPKFKNEWSYTSTPPCMLAYPTRGQFHFVLSSKISTVALGPTQSAIKRM